MQDFTKNPIFHDIDGYGVCIGTVVALNGNYEDIDPDYDKTYEVVAYHDESGEYGIAEITDTSGDFMEWRPNYAIPLIWVWNYQKYAAI